MNLLYFFSIIVISVASFFGLYSAPTVPPQALTAQIVSVVATPTPEITPSITPEITPIITPTPSPIPTPAKKEVVVKKVKPTPTPVITPDPTPIIVYVTPTPIAPTPTPKSISPEVGIALCKAKSDQETEYWKNQTTKILNENQPGILALANAYNNDLTEKAALQYGYITQSDVKHYEDVYIDLINKGTSLELAKSAADSIGSTYWTYIRSLHDWATNELNKMTANSDSLTKKYANDVYLKCLNSL